MSDWTFWLGAWLPGFLSGFFVCSALHDRRERKELERKYLRLKAAASPAAEEALPAQPDVDTEHLRVRGRRRTLAEQWAEEDEEQRNEGVRPEGGDPQ